jgi:hypothetical protein
MNGKRARILRAIAGDDRKAYRDLKHAYTQENGQHPKLTAERNRKPKQAIQPTWPATPNQRKQSRPEIVVKPARVLISHLVKPSEQRKQEIRRAMSVMPKWQCDMAACRGFV